MTVLSKEKLILPFAELRKQPLPSAVVEYRDDIHTLVNWVDEYLCKPHPALGRSGPVCPFVPTALELGLLYVFIYPHVDLDTDIEEFRQIILKDRDLFLETEPRTGNTAQFKSFLMLFPNLPSPKAHKKIDTVQASLQEAFCEKGLMVGEFHPGPPDKRGLWNERFRPLECPIPLIAIRHMVPTDILFLKDQSSLVAEYLRIFGDMVPSKFAHLVEEAAVRFGFDMPEKRTAKSSAPTVIYLLEKHKISYEIHRHSLQDEEIRIPQDFAKALGYDVACISKTMFVRDPERSTYALVVCGATRQPDLKKIAQLLGVRQLVCADLREMRRKIGHPPFSITPIGIQGIPTFMDEDLLRFPTILTGSGVKRMEIELAPADLQRLSNAHVMPLLAEAEDE